MMTVLALVLSVSTAAGAPKSEGAGARGESADVKKARELFQWAQRLYKQARYAEAISKFEEAYAVRPHPVIYFNIGRCHEQLGDTAKALRAYRDYLRLLPDAQDKENVTDAIANLERRLREKGVQQLMVFADPPQARIVVDGQDLGRSPATVELVAGNHTMMVTAEGYEKVERSFVMQTTRATEMTITLRPVASAPLASDAPKVEPAVNLGPSAPPPPVIVAAPEAAPKPRVWTYVAGGAAVVSMGVGVGLGVVANNTAERMRGEVRPQGEVQALHDRAQSMATGANVAYGVAAVAAATAIVLFFVEK